MSALAGSRPQDEEPPRQLRSFLELGAVQLDAALKEADARVGSLASAVSGLSTDARSIEQFAGELLSGDATQIEHARGRIGELAGRLSAHAQAAITALQFYDKLVQRLSHVREGLVIPADRHHDALDAAAWESLLEEVRSRYSMVEERVMFDFLMRGVSASSMLTALVSMQDKGDTGEMELF
ncbi:MAG: hypothetical protein U1F30_01285 [Steroidobacteraceae bacterium]